jgi:UTP-glucose-1-phosphate uridylyltransferase
MAAGVGSRFGGPKQTMPIGPAGEWLLEFGIFDARRAGFGRVVLVIRDELAETFEQRLEAIAPDLDVALVSQRVDDLPAGVSAGARTKPWGTGHAVLSVRNSIESSFAIMNADDFYGTRAFELAADACARAARTGAATVVGMRLDRTLSPHGPVTRGWCQIAGDRVLRIEEVMDIERGDSALSGAGREGRLVFDGDEMVSMNFWVFPQSIFASLSAKFDAFLARAGQDPSAEFLLPEVVNDLIADGALNLGGVEAPGPWFGLTHREDHPGVAAGLAALVGAGIYPSPLWADDAKASP